MQNLYRFQYQAVFLGFVNVFVVVNAFSCSLCILCAEVPMPVNKRQLCTGNGFPCTRQTKVKVTSFFMAHSVYIVGNSSFHKDINIDVKCYFHVFL